MYKKQGMKLRLAVISILTILFFGCKKDNASFIDNLQGQWELRRASGMLTTDYPAGNGKILKFSGNICESFQHEELIDRGSYEIIPDKTVSVSTCMVFEEGIYNKRILFHKASTNQKTFIRLSGDTLSFVSGCFAIDAGSESKYVRIK